MKSRGRKIFGQHETKGGKVENCRLWVEVEFFIFMWYNGVGIGREKLNSLVSASRRTPFFRSGCKKKRL